MKIAIIFSHSEGCLFTLLIVSLVVQKLLILIRSHLFIFALFIYLLLLFPIFWGRRWERGSGVGTRVRLWRIHVDVWQNQYNIVK